MPDRNFPDWLEAYCDYATFGEAPRRMAFWCGVSAIAGALRRRVWIDMAYFKWFPNFYIILVAPPGIVSKSTTAAVAMNLLRQVPDIRFGPDVVTWQALVTSLAASAEAFQLEENGDFVTMSPITIESGELGNLLNPHDREMVDLLVTLWDGRSSFKKLTKMSGNDEIVNPWINIIACTTPAWIAGNVPEYMIGGGFTSRCIFIFAEEKARYVAYPGLQVPKNLQDTERRLVQDLEAIATRISGPYRLLPSAVEWGNSWYRSHFENRPPNLDDERFGGYIARKQTHIHKLSMVIAAAQRDERTITAEDLQAANAMMTDLEADMPLVFAKIGKSEASNAAERLITLVRRRGAIPYLEGLQFLHAYFPAEKDLEGVLAGAIKAGYISLEKRGESFFLLSTTLSSNSAPVTQQ